MDLVPSDNLSFPEHPHTNHPNSMICTSAGYTLGDYSD